MQQRLRGFFSQRFAASGAMDYQIFGLLGVSIVLTSVLTTAKFGDVGMTLGLFFANVGAVATIFVFLVAFDRYLHGKDAEVRLSLGILVLIGAGVGALKGFLTWLGLILFGLADDTSFDLVSRAALAAFTGMIVVPVVALFGSLKHRYAEQREGLIREKISSVEGDIYPATLLRFVSDAKQRLAKSNNPLDRGALVGELRDIVNSDLRPLSEEIWRRESLRFPSFKLSHMAKFAIRGHVYSVAWVVPLWAISTLAPTIRVFSFEEGLPIQVARTIVLIAGLLIAKLIPVRTTIGAFAVYLTSVVLIAATQVLFGTLLSNGRVFEDDVGFIIANLIWLFQLTLFIGMAKVFLELVRKVENEFEKFLDESDLKELSATRELALRDRQLAQFLHGHMQSRLNRVAARIESRSHSADLSADFDEIEKVLNESLEEFGREQVTSLEEVILRLEKDWGGMVQLTFALSPVAMTQKQLENFSEVISEGVANAVRHGFASRILLTLGEGPLLHISDDGTGPRHGAPGLGSTYFDSISNDWELTASGSGSVLRLRLN